jgi:exopolysaccharide biosynthesis WecB/TagA/CpsF family protein
LTNPDVSGYHDAEAAWSRTRRTTQLNDHRSDACGWPLVCVTVSSQAALLSDLRMRLASGEGFSVATMNLDHVVKLRRDSTFRQAYAAQTHVTADGRPIVWMSTLAGRPAELVTGSDLVDPLVALCAEISAPIALLGSTQDVLDQAASQLQGRFPGLEVAALIAPPMGFDPEGAASDAILKDLAQSGARVCLLALGAPKQEIFAAHAMQKLPGIGFVSVGAGIDFIAGAQRRAPRVMRILALEWLWRLAGNPRRLFGRYFACIGVLPGLAQTALVYRLHHGARTPE